jgi:hypothetical protein
MRPLLLLLAAAALAGTIRVPVPGSEAWHGRYAELEPPAACAHCSGPRGFAVLGGEPWFLLSDRLVSGSGASLRLPSAGVDVAAGPDGLWVLCQEHAAVLEGDELLLRQPRWTGAPLEIAGDGAVMSATGVDGAAFLPGQQSPWGAGMGVHQGPDGWSVSWPGVEPLALPGPHIVDARPIGLLADGAWVLALTDSADGSAPDGVRFVAAHPGGLRQIAAGAPNGGTDLQPRRLYAVDPSDGGVYTVVVLDDDRISLRRY